MTAARALTVLMWLSVAVLVLLALRLVSLLARRSCTASNICSGDYGFVIVVGFAAIVIVLGCLYGIDKLVPGGRAPGMLRRLAEPENPIADLAGPPPPPRPAGTGPVRTQPDDLPGRLKRLDELRAAGTITEQEHGQRRTEILREL